MKVSEIIQATGWEVEGDEIALNREISGVFISDLLSWVMGHCEENQAWITVQTHLNVVAVAALKEIGALIIVQNAQIPEETKLKAIEEHLAIINCQQSAYEAAIALYQLGL